MKSSLLTIIFCLALPVYSQQTVGPAAGTGTGSTPDSVAPPAQYPNTIEGLQSLMNDMLAATKRGDKQGVDALIKQTEFADYAAYLVRTYNPDPLAGEDWNITYRQWLGNNEDQLRELLQTLAKDDGGQILVGKASDDPTQGRGFEWALVHYAHIPIDIYRVTLVFSRSPGGQGELIGYWVYSDWMFRWDSIVPFAKPGAYQSAPSTSSGTQTPAVGAAQYPNTPDGLQGFLTDLRAAAKSGDHAKVDLMIKQTEIPEYRNWFCSVYIPGSGLSWATPYGNNLAQSEQGFKETWEKLAQGDEEIQVRKLVDKPGGDRGMEWGMIHNSRTPLDIYHAGWKSSTGTPEEWDGYFIYIDGMFRLDSQGRRLAVVRNSAPFSRPVVTYNPPPRYSKEAEDAKIEGVVVIQGVVGTDGRFHDIKVTRPLGYGLDEEAIECVEQWRFKPAKRGGSPFPVVINIEVRFQLGDRR